MIGLKKIGKYERGLLFIDGELSRVLTPGVHWIFRPFVKGRMDLTSVRAPWLDHVDLDVVLKSVGPDDDLRAVALNDSERAFVWVDGRFDRILDTGRYAYWSSFKDVRIEKVDAADAIVERGDLDVVLAAGTGVDALVPFVIEEGHVGVAYRGGDYLRTLRPGQYATWKRSGKVCVHNVDLRERMLDVSGQEIITADKVSLRLNAVVTYRIVDPRKAVEQVDDLRQALYREAQLVLREAIGSRELDELLADKGTATRQIEQSFRERAAVFGVALVGTGIRDIILPGDMKALLNRVTEAKKGSEANAISRREETAAVRSQMNTAKLMEANPALMRLRELEVLERVAQNSKLNVVLGEKGLADRIVNLL